VQKYFGQGRFFRCGRPHFLVKKHRIFWNLWCVRADKRGLSQFIMRTGGGQFSRFCADVLYGRPLHFLSYTQPNINLHISKI